METAKQILNEYPFGTSDPFGKFYEYNDIISAMEKYAASRLTNAEVRIKELENEVVTLKEYNSIKETESIDISRTIYESRFSESDTPDGFLITPNHEISLQNEIFEAIKEGVTTTITSLENEIENIQIELKNSLLLYQNVVNTLHQSQERSKALVEAILKPNPWGIIDVLKKLKDATNILLDRYSYDGHYHEEIRICTIRAEEISKDLTEALNAYNEK